MGWEDKAKGIAYVMGNESFTEPYYRNRNLNGQSPVIYGNNSYYQATCYWTYGQGYTGAVEGNNPVHTGGFNAIGTATTTTTLNIREGANTWSNILTRIPRGVTVPVIAQNNRWYEVYYNGKTGWIDGDYTDGLDESLGSGSAPTNMPVGDNLTVTSPVGLWLNNGPSVNSGTIVLLPNGTPVKALEFKNGWYKVNYEGTIGWIDAQYTSANGKDILPNKTVQKHTQEQKSFTQHSVDGTVTVTCAGLWINEKPFVNDANIIVVPHGVKLHTTAESSNGWYKVTYKGQTGWIGGEPYSKVIGQVKPQQPNTPSSIQQKPLGKVEVTADALYMNTNPEPNDGIITALKQGTVVPYYKVSNNGWYEVYYNGKMGWIGGAPYSKIVGSSIQQQTPKKQEIAIVQSPVGLWLNGSPNTSNPIEVMPYNATMKVLGQQENWTKVEYNGQIGWAYTQYLNISGSSSRNNSSSNSSSSDKLSQIGTGTISANGGLWLNGNPDLNNPDGIEVMPYKANMKVLGQQGNWTKVDYNGQIGWAYTQYLNIN